MHHHSRFDQLVSATEELIHENERMRTKYTAFEAALQEVLDNQKALWRAAQSHIRGYPPHNAASSKEMKRIDQATA